MKKPIDSISKSNKAAPEEAAVSTPPETPVEEPAKPAESEVPAEAVATPAETKETPAPEEEKGDTFESLFPEPGIAIAGPPSWIWWILLLVATGVLAVVGYGLARGKIDSWLASDATPTPSAQATETPGTTPTPSAEPTATPTPSPSATPAAAEISMRVLNGTTVEGAAGRARDTLQKAGFTVRTVGNANNQNYAATVIYYAAGKLAEAQQVQAALSSYQTTLEESTLANPDDILVVVGQK